MAILNEKYLGHKEAVVKTVKDPTPGDKPYELVQEWHEYEVTDEKGTQIVQRDKHQFTRTIKTEKYDKEAEIEKRESTKPSKKRKSSKKNEVKSELDEE